MSSNLPYKCIQYVTLHTSPPMQNLTSYKPLHILSPPSAKVKCGMQPDNMSSPYILFLLLLCHYVPFIYLRHHRSQHILHFPLPKWFRYKVRNAATHVESMWINRFPVQGQNISSYSRPDVTSVTRNEIICKSDLPQRNSSSSSWRSNYQKSNKTPTFEPSPRDKSNLPKSVKLLMQNTWHATTDF